MYAKSIQTGGAGVRRMLVAAAAVAFAVAGSVHGHGRVVEQGFVNTDLGVTAGGGNDACGTTGDDAWAKYLAIFGEPRVISAGKQETWNWQLNAADGGGPMTVEIDPTCSGKSFSTSLKVITDVPGTAGINTQPVGTEFPLTVEIPSNINCNCPGATCLLRFINKFKFTSCRFVKIAGGPQAAPAAAAPPQQPQYGSGMPGAGYYQPRGYPPYGSFGYPPSMEYTRRQRY